MDKRTNFSIWYFVVGLIVMALAQDWLLRSGHNVELSYSAFKKAVAARQVADVIVGKQTVRGTITEAGLRAVLPANAADQAKRAPADKHTFSSTRVEDADLARDLQAAQVSFTGEVESQFLSLVLSWVLPLAFMFVIWYFLFQKMGSGGNGMMSIGKSKAKVYVEDDIKVGFDDVAGIDEAVDELREVVAFLTTPERFTRLGGRLPKGILLVGPPGTGKTLLARAVAGQARVPFFSLSGSEFVELFVGVGAARVRDLFQQAQKTAPCIIFIDELDALGRARGANPVGNNEEREQTLNQLLTEMDGFDPNSGVVLMAATNRPEILDSALLRAGRFDRQVVVDRPDVAGREAILRLHAKKVKTASGVDLPLLAARTPGFVGADLANITNEAALLAARAGKELVDMSDFEEAIDRTMAGLQKKSSIMTPAEKHRVAFHEAGHALVGSLVSDADPIHKVSIIPRGAAALGYTLQIPLQDRHLYTRGEILDRLAVLLGGRVAEELMFDDVSTGASDDLQKATQLARSCVAEYGMSKSLGTMSFGREQLAYLSAAGMIAGKEYGADMANRIDLEVRQLLDEAHVRVSSLLKQNRDALLRVAKRLEEKETLSGDELRAVISACPVAEQDRAPSISIVSGGQHG